MKSVSKWLVVLVALVFAASMGGVAPANAKTHEAHSIVINGKLKNDGSFTVVQTLTFTDDSAPETITQKLANSRESLNETYYRYTHSSITATVDGAAVEPKVVVEGASSVVSVPSKGAHTIVLRYNVNGTVHQSLDGNVLFQWSMLQGLSVPVKEVSGLIESPAPMISIDCKAGVPNAATACLLTEGGTHDNPSPIFKHGPVKANDVVSVGVVYPSKGLSVNEEIGHYWTLGRAFTLNVTTGLATLAVLVLGGLAIALTYRKWGRDQIGGDPQVVASFEPVAEGRTEFRVHSNIRPGHVGTVADECVDPIDVSATILDLAVRGYVRIHELEQRPHAPLDWEFERRSEDDSALRPFEKRLLDAIAPKGERVAVSALANAVTPVITDVQRDLYADVVEYGWFERSPEDARNGWGRAAGWSVLGAFALTAVLVAVSTWALVGLAAIAVAFGLVWIAEQMPRRTAAGASLLAGLNVLAGTLATQPTDQQPVGEEYAQISAVLPYAIVLGGKGRWVQALADADDDPNVPDPTDLSWYHAPGEWSLSDLPKALASFVTTVHGELFGR